MPDGNYRRPKCCGPESVNRSKKAGATCTHDKPLFANGKARMFCYTCAPKPVKKDRKPYTPKSIETVACAQCGGFFARGLGHAKYCSADCRSKSCNKVAQIARVDRADRPCKQCGVIFTPEYGVKRKYHCSEDCRVQHRMAHKQARLNTRMSTDQLLKLIRSMRTFIAQSIARGGFTKRSRTREVLGCDWGFFKSHIETKFAEGMSWEKRSEWHLDHILPISGAKTEADAVRLNHYSNLQPLWAKYNMSKGAKLNWAANGDT